MLIVNRFETARRGLEAIVVIAALSHGTDTAVSGQPFNASSGRTLDTSSSSQAQPAEKPTPVIVFETHKRQGIHIHGKGLHAHPTSTIRVEHLLDPKQTNTPRPTSIIEGLPSTPGTPTPVAVG